VNIVLHEPEIPHNTGNIGRTCVVVGAVLHLIRPLGFFTDDKALKKSGLDYWNELDVRYYDNFDDFLIKNNHPIIYVCETDSVHYYTDVKYEENAFIMFGKESAGIPADILTKYKETSIKIPMLKGQRSLNLANSVTIVLYEALRQQRFNGLE
jgi:tRNA (cytidine/uridine-2'-O-)-methyltransferase